MKPIIFLMSSLVLISFVILFFLVGLERRNPVCPYIDTKFSPDFSVAKWKRVNIGLTRNKVVQLLGAPLSYSKLEYLDDSLGFYNAYYTADGAWPFADFAWKQFLIVYNKENIVVQKKANWWYN